GRRNEPGHLFREGLLIPSGDGAGGVGVKRWIPNFSFPGLLVGVLFLAASLTPSLIPRDPLLQGILGGLVMALGYLSWRIVELLWRAADMPVLKGRLSRFVEMAVGLGVLVTLALALNYA